MNDQPQEWTQKTDQGLSNILLNEKGEVILCAAIDFSGIISAHKAALAAEQTKYDMMVHAACVDNATINKLQEQLAAERDRNFVAEKELRDKARLRIEELQRQLAVAKKLANLLKVSYWAQCPLDVAVAADEVLKL